MLSPGQTDPDGGAMENAVPLLPVAGEIVTAASGGVPAGSASTTPPTRPTPETTTPITARLRTARRHRVGTIVGRAFIVRTPWRGWGGGERRGPASR